MTKLELIMILLPIVFMIHEYEEIIMFKYWLGNNRNELKRRFPKFEQFLTHRGHFDYSTATFAVGTAHEFLLIAAISFCSIWLGAYHWWFAAFCWILHPSHSPSCTMGYIPKIHTCYHYHNLDIAILCLCLC